MELESGSGRFRVTKTPSQEKDLVNDAVPASTKFKNNWAVNIFTEWQRLREVKVPVLDCGLFKDYDLHKVTAVSALPQGKRRIYCFKGCCFSERKIPKMHNYCNGVQEGIISCCIVVASNESCGKYAVISINTD